MRSVLVLSLVVLGVVLGTFALFPGVEVWIEESLNNESHRTRFVLLSGAVLALDILLPVPSSLVMILNGQVLGVLLGSLTSLAASSMCSILGYALGRLCTTPMIRMFGSNDVQRGREFMTKYGAIAVPVSRVIPVFAEVVSVLSGTTKVPFGKFFLLSLIGNGVVAVIYAYLGAHFHDAGYNLTAPTIAIASSLILAWIIQTVLSQRSRARS